MVNESQKRSRAQRAKWLASGALGTVNGPLVPKKSQRPYVPPPPFEVEGPLPGAPNFYRWLCDRYPGQTVTVGPPVVLDRSYGIDYTKSYDVLLDGEVIGQYRTFGPKPRTRGRASQEYRGRIPGYLNEAVALSNLHRGAGDPWVPDDKVGLTFDHRHFEAGYLWGPDPGGRFVETGWKRQDGHDQIVFP